VWKPSPPLSVRNFYDAFLQWRADANMDNAIADRLPALFEEVGFINIVTTPEHETTQRGEAGFDASIGLWSRVIATRGRQLVSDGFLTEF